MFSSECVCVCSCFGSRLGMDVVMWALIQTNSLSVKKGGDGAISPAKERERKREERREL